MLKIQDAIKKFYHRCIAKKTDITREHDMRINLYLKANEDADAIRAQAKADAERIINEAEAIALKDKRKLVLLAEQYPIINEKLEKEVKRKYRKRSSKKGKEISMAERDK